MRLFSETKAAIMQRRYPLVIYKAKFDLFFRESLEKNWRESEFLGSVRLPACEDTSFLPQNSPAFCPALAGD
jgi:hypothetical protein